MLDLHLEEAEISYLINKYRHSDDQVNYAEFCKNINVVFESEEYQRQLLKMKNMVLNSN